MRVFKGLTLLLLCASFFITDFTEAGEFKRYYPLGFKGKNGGELFWDVVNEKVVEYDVKKNIFMDVKISKETEDALKRIHREALIKAIISVLSTEEGWRDFERLAMKEGGEIAEIMKRFKGESGPSDNYVVYLVNRLVDKKYKDRTPENYMKAIEELRKAASEGYLNKLILEIESF